MENKKRLNGLDSLRALAIVIVLMFHYKSVVSQENIFGFVSQLGWVGVDLFFVLSGYLIGNQILSALAKGQDFSLKLFYIRRLLRTLPNYYAVLALYFIFPVALSGSSTASLWSFLTFTQNFGFRLGHTFTHSWSLCIEEQFYLLFPLIALAFAFVKRSIAFVWLAMVSAILLGMFLRGFNWYTHGQEAITGSDYWQHIYYSSFTRFDELLPGIAIALLKNYHSTTYAKIVARGNLVLVLGVLSIAAMLYVLQNYFYIEDYGFSFLVATFGFSFIAISFAVLVLAALSPNSLLSRIRLPGAASLALWSYAIYLIHKPLFQILKSWLPAHGVNTDKAFGVMIIMVVSIVAGWALYQFIETPFMKLRDRFYPDNIKRDFSESKPAQAV
ncbi:MAG: acyltransferase [Gammaproteobacteria bacterium]|nr:MAG: acyltransferase [Gammaproteobacteria bacterium]